MFVDLFVGTLTRYYSEQWANSRTRAGAHSPFGGSPNVNTVNDPVELQGKIAEWREETASKLRTHLREELEWQEGMTPPHYIGELGIGGYGGAIMLAAYSCRRELPRPTMFMETWKDDPAISTLMKAEKADAVWEIINCGIWFPIEFKFGIGMKDPSGQSVRAGSIELLWHALQHLNTINWNASAEQIAQWRNHKLTDSDTFETQCRFGFSVFLQMCEHARIHRLPMKLHY